MRRRGTTSRNREEKQQQQTHNNDIIEQARENPILIVLITKYNIAFEILIKFDIIYKQAKIYFNNPETILSPLSPGKTDRKMRNKGA